MADKLDILISDYMTGMLDVKIKSRIKWITRQKNEERIGSSGTKCNTAPQEQRLLAIEADMEFGELGRLQDHKDTLDDLMKVIEGTKVKEIIIARFKYRLSWHNVGKRVFLEESAARRQYAGFKKTLRNGLWAETIT